MALSFYDASVLAYLQTTKAMTRFLEKGRTHFEQSGKDLSEVVEARIYEDMLPFRFQVAAVAQHSIGALGSIEEGRFKPPGAAAGLDYQALQDLMAQTVAELKALTPEGVDQLEERELVFQLGKMELPFVARDFILSFSMPNFYFHATTAYDILRMLGVPVGKADFMGPLRFKR